MINSSQDTAAPQSHDQRAPRESLFLGAEITHGRLQLRGRVRNVSETGALVECVHACSIGDVVDVSFRGVDQIRATVARITDRGLGLHFAVSIDPAHCRKSVLPRQADWTTDYVLCLREGVRQERWQNDLPPKRPKLR